RVGQGAAAVVHYRETQYLRPWDGEAQVEFGAVLVDTGALPEAIEILQRRLRDCPDDMSAIFHLGQARAALGETAAAAAQFRRCLELAPEDPLGAATRLAECEGADAADLPAAYLRCLFDQYAEHFDEALLVRLRYRGPWIVHEAVVRVQGETTGDILDLGCGTGLAGLLFPPLARHLAGVDLSPKMIDKARERGIYDRLEVAEAVAAMTAAPASWDVVVAADVLVYQGDLAPMFAAAALALRPGGILAATVEAGDTLDFELQATRRFRHHPDYVRRTALAAGLDLVLSETAVPRFERNEPVKALVFVVRRH
ncbi:MAG: methyltransferase domain-containing protein, partial [Alphaproteobacteria bacterium]|nr:methyltransferase domain-containing protein [Alphaproteobacteria bacterium]